MTRPDRAHPGDQRDDQRRDLAAAARAALRAVGDLRLLGGPGVGDRRVGVERRLPVDPVGAGLGEHHEPAAAAGGQHRRPVGRGDQAQLLEQVLGDAARVQSGPGSERATLRSWVSRRVASAYGWGVGSAGCMSWRIVSAANVTIAPEHQPLPQAARKPGWVIGLTSPISTPPATIETAATPSSAAPSVGRRRSAAESSGTVR
jgi:hypothetical protein